MIAENLILNEYEEVLIGKKLNFKYSIKGTQTNNISEIRVIWKYAIEKIFKWTPKEASRFLTTKIVEQFCLDKTLPGLGVSGKKNFISNYDFVLQYIYPEEISYSFYDETIETYIKAAHLGPYKNDKDEIRLPKNFFSDEKGYERAEILINYALDYYCNDYSTIELYEIFSDKDKGTKWLKEKKLNSPLKLLYESPLDYFHSAIKRERKNDLLYYNNKIRNAVT